jgi:hypothetical protein
MAVAMIGPMPGMAAKRWLMGLLLCQAMICASMPAICVSSLTIASAITCSTPRHVRHAAVLVIPDNRDQPDEAKLRQMSA